MYHPALTAPGEGREHVDRVARMERRVILDVVAVYEHDARELGRQAQDPDEISDPRAVRERDHRRALARTGRQVAGERGVELDGEVDQRGLATRNRSPGRIES